MYSVVFRFALASFVLLIYSKAKKLSLSFSTKDHLFFALQGILLFGMNYWLVYMSEQTLTSGLVAAAYSTIIFFNIFFGKVFLKNTIHKKVILGAALGIFGTALIFKPELSGFSFSDGNFIALLLCVGSIILASLGNITSAFNQSKKRPVIQTNAYAMLYGALLMTIIAIIMGKEFVFDFSYKYVLSLIYLSVFGSVIAFSAYLTLVGKVGPGKAAYTILVLPVIALLISTVLEGYNWSAYSVFGVVLIAGGNVLALRK